MNAGVLDLMESAGFDGNGGIAANSITGRSEEAVLKTNLVKKGNAYLLLLSVRFRIVWAISVFLGMAAVVIADDIPST